MKLRPYQQEAGEAIDRALAERDDNPCVILPTGSGKTIIFADRISHYVKSWPGTRIAVLAHVKELVQQAYDKLLKVWPEAPAGIYSAGMGRDMDKPITIGSIQSMVRHAGEFPPFDLALIDEAHRIPLKSEGMYRNFLEVAALSNPNLRTIGFTATPYRLQGGSIIGPGYVLNHVAYEKNVRDMIEDGYLAPVTSKHGKASPDISHVHTRSGEFVTSELVEAIDQRAVVDEAVREALRLAEDRRSIIFFCINIEHAEHVSDALRRRGIDAPVVHSRQGADTRRRNLRRFDRGQVRAICNVNVLSEGFDSEAVDCIVLLRPTQSAGLYVQQVGRGLRWIGGDREASHQAGKYNCLVLDFAGNVERHGPLDTIRARDGKAALASPIGNPTPGEAPTKVCPECQSIVLAAKPECLDCGFLFPKPEPRHDAQASDAAIISTDSDPETVEVTDVEVARHKKAGKPDSLRVTYYAGNLNHYREWVCLEHAGFAGANARRWWIRRFGEPVPATVSDALTDMWLASKLADLTERIEVRRSGRHTEVTQVFLRDARQYATV